MKILLVEDDSETAKNLDHVLSAEGHKVDVAVTGTEGLSKARCFKYTVMIIDRMLPELDGLSLVRQLRDEGIDTPIVFLTTIGGLDDRVSGLNAGADDYLTKPFAFSELFARIYAVTRRAENSPTLKFRIRDLEMDLLTRTVHRRGKEIILQPQEFKLLEFMIRHADRLVTKKMILEKVWELNFDPRTNIVETHMSRLRAKIDRGFGAELIHTIRGNGYILRTD